MKTHPLTRSNQIHLFKYGQKEICHLKAADERLKVLIDKEGLIEREVDDDLFSSLVHQIISQQISTAAQLSVFSRLSSRFADLQPQTISEAGTDDLIACGIPARKAQAIWNLAEDISQGNLNLEDLRLLNEKEIMKILCSYKGIGPWTVHMFLLFGLQKQDICPFSDFGIRKGFCILYDLDFKSVKEEDFKDFRKRISPCGSLASLYLWKLAQKGKNDQ